MHDTEESFLLVTESAELSLPHLAAELVEHRSDYAALAQRVLTRRDIDWKDPLQDEEPEIQDSFGVESDPLLPTNTQSMTQAIR